MVPENATDTVLGILGASVGLAGLLLVFCGFLFAQAASFPQEHTDDATINRYRNAGKLGVWPFLGSLGIALAATVWLVVGGCLFYYGIVTIFVILLVATALYGAVTVRRYL